MFETDFCRSLIGDLKFTKLEMYNWMDKESHLFLPPPMFCRMDMPQDCLYRDIPQKRKPNRNVPRVPNNDNVIRVSKYDVVDCGRVLCTWIEDYKLLAYCNN